MSWSKILKVLLLIFLIFSFLGPLESQCLLGSRALKVTTTEFSFQLKKPSIHLHSSSGSYLLLFPCIFLLGRFIKTHVFSFSLWPSLWPPLQAEWSGISSLLWLGSLAHKINSTHLYWLSRQQKKSQWCCGFLVWKSGYRNDPKTGLDIRLAKEEMSVLWETPKSSWMKGGWTYFLQHPARQGQRKIQEMCSTS